MTRIGLWLPLCVGALALAACAEVKEALFEREGKLGQPLVLLPGKSLREDLVRQLGEPDEIDQRRLDGRATEALHYLDVMPSDAEPGRAVYRYLALEFSKNVLNAYVRYGSESAADRRLGDFAPIAGKTTRRELEERLGAPDGKAIPPSTIGLPPLDLDAGGAPFPVADLPDGVAEAWLYLEQTFEGRLRPAARRTLIVFLDERGVVLESKLLQELMTKRH